jgi:arginase
MPQTTTPATLIGVPLDLGAKNLGVDIGPEAFRYTGIVDKLTSAGFVVHDTGNVHCKNRENLDPGNPRLRYLSEIVTVNEAVAKLTEQAAKDGSKSVVLGGDHSVCLGAVAGASVAVSGELGLIYFDAHGDMNTDKTTLTGNIHGMHLASLMGFGAPELAHIYGEHVKIAKENLLHIGGSDFDQSELDLIHDQKLQAFTLFNLLTSSLAPLLKMIDDQAARTSTSIALIASMPPALACLTVKAFPTAKLPLSPSTSASTAMLLVLT